MLVVEVRRVSVVVIAVGYSSRYRRSCVSSGCRRASRGSVGLDLPADRASRARLVRARTLGRTIDVALLEIRCRIVARARTILGLAVEVPAASAADPLDERAARELPLAPDLARRDVLSVKDLVERLDADA